MTILSALPYPGTVKYVVQVGLYPSSDPGFGIELQRSVGSTSNFGQIAVISPETAAGFVRYTDVLPHTTATYYYRARHTKPGYTDGAFTGITASTVGRLMQFQPGNGPFIGLTGAGVGQDLFLSSGASVKVGTESAAGSIGKTIRFPATQYVAAAAGVGYSYGLGTLVPQTTGTGFSYRASYVMPKGITITGFRAALQRKSAGSAAVCKLYRIDTAASATLITTLTSTQTAGSAVSLRNSSALSETVSTANYFIGDLSLSSSGASNNAALLYTEFDYAMADYQNAY